ncbi:MAG: hypothetical protein AB1468_03800 [Candidatus Micrarchaeota archaeon]
MRRVHNAIEWRMHNLYLAVFVVIACAWLLASGFLERMLLRMGELEYLGALLAGLFYSYGLTTPLAVIVFAVLAENLNPFLIALIGALGALLADFALFSNIGNIAGKHVHFQFFAERKMDHLFGSPNKSVARNIDVNVPLIRSKLLYSLSPLIAGVVLALPVPDELAIVFLGLEKYEKKRFFAFVFLFKFLGILAICLAAKALRG